MIKSLFRIILYVQDMDVMVRFYRDVMGLSLKYPKVDDDYEGEFWVEFDIDGCTLVLHGGGQQRLDKDTPKLNFLVDDIEATRQALIDKGISYGRNLLTCAGGKGL